MTSQRKPLWARLKYKEEKVLLSGYATWNINHDLGSTNFNWIIAEYVFGLGECFWGFVECVSASRCLLQGAELSLAFGRRYGLIGRNGLGKTTLLKMLASRNLRVPSHISILHVEQEVAGDETSALQSVLESDTLREELLGEEKSLNARIANGT